VLYFFAIILKTNMWLSITINISTAPHWALSLQFLCISLKKTPGDSMCLLCLVTSHSTEYLERWHPDTNHQSYSNIVWMGLMMYNHIQS
jgi:hypothetical protein